MSADVEGAEAEPAVYLEVVVDLPGGHAEDPVGRVGRVVGREVAVVEEAVAVASHAHRAAAVVDGAGIRLLAHNITAIVQGFLGLQKMEL